MAVQTKKYLSGQGMGGKKQTPLIMAGGVRQLALSIRRVNDKELSKEMREASKAAAEKIVPFAKRKAPVGDTGKLRKSIKASATRSQGRIMAGNNRKAGPAAVPYARAVHSGRYIPSTGARTKGQPFIKKAVPEAWPSLVKEYEAAMNRIAKEFNKKPGVHQMKGAFKK